MNEESEMWQCQMHNCGYIYNSEKGCKKVKFQRMFPLKSCRIPSNVHYVGLAKQCLNPCKLVNQGKLYNK